MIDRRSKAAFVASLAHRPLLVDGAIGTETERAGVLPGTLVELLNLTNPTLIRSIHQQYRQAEATVLTANTFAANRYLLAQHAAEDQVAAAIQAGVTLAREVAGDALLVAGAVSGALSPDTDEASVDLSDAYREQIALLRDAGVDLFMLESFAPGGGISEVLAAIHEEAPEIPVIAQFRLDADTGAMQQRRVIAEAGRAIEYGADAIGLNCGLSPGEMYPVLTVLRQSFPRIPIAAQPSVGRQQAVNGRLVQTTSPDAFATYAKRFLKLGIAIVGSCCGTSPAHTQAMAGAVRMGAVQRGGMHNGGTFPLGQRSEPNEEAESRAFSHPHERSQLGARLGMEFVVSVEVNPPASTAYAKSLDAARRLLDGGATVINTTDGARASLRMDNLAFAAIMERELGCETILHVCGRDRNLLGTVAHLMAAHALGIRNLVLITGDPPKMGAFPNATPVYDVDSLGLLRIVRAMNAGEDPAGGAMDAPTSFLCGVGVEPAATDLDYEIDRLYRKKEAGADFVMTQPVYDAATMERFFAATQDLDLPILMGVVPLASHRNAAFVHANIPGMAIPPQILERMKAAGDGPEARSMGVDIAVESLLHAQGRIAGAYIVPPLGLYSLATQIIDRMRLHGILPTAPGA